MQFFAYVPKFFPVYSCHSSLKFFQPVGIYPKKYEWAARPLSGSSNGILHQDLHPPPPPPMQIGGDCSLWIRSATLDFDDGLWECQVTASDFTAQDALTSQPVRLVVRGKCVGLVAWLAHCKFANVAYD